MKLINIAVSIIALIIFPIDASPLEGINNYPASPTRSYQLYKNFHGAYEDLFKNINQKTLEKIEEHNKNIKSYALLNFNTENKEYINSEIQFATNDEYGIEKSSNNKNILGIITGGKNLFSIYPLKNKGNSQKYPINLDKFNQMWIDYEESPTIKNCDINLSLGGYKKNLKGIGDKSTWNIKSKKFIQESPSEAILPEYSKEIGGGLKRKIFEIKKDYAANELYLDNVKILLQSYDNSPCVGNIKKIRLVSTYYGPYPLYGKYFDDLMLSINAPYNYSKELFGNIEYPNFLSYIDFSQKNISDLGQYGKEPYLKTYIKITNINIGNNSYIYIGEKRGTEQLPFISIKMYQGNGISKSFNVAPNRSIKLPPLGNVIGAEISIPKPNSGYTFNLDKFYIYQPEIADFKSIFQVSLPIFLKDKPAINIENQNKDLIVGNGIIYGSIQNNHQSTKFITNISEKFDYLYGINFSHKMGILFYENNKCPVKIKLVYQNSYIEKEYCPSLGFDNVFIPIYRWEHDSGSDFSKRGGLKFIEWTLIPSQSISNAESKFEFSFEMYGTYKSSIFNQLMSDGIASIGNNKIQLDKEYFFKELSRKNSKFMNWYELEGGVIKLLASKEKLNLSTNKYFSIEEIKVEGSSSIPLNLWSQIGEENIENGKSKNITWLKILLILPVLYFFHFKILRKYLNRYSIKVDDGLAVFIYLGIIALIFWKKINPIKSEDFRISIAILFISLIIPYLFYFIFNKYLKIKNGKLLIHSYYYLISVLILLITLLLQIYGNQEWAIFSCDSAYFMMVIGTMLNGHYLLIKNVKN